MNNEFLSSALQNALDDVQKTCPEIKAMFALDQNRELIAQTAKTPGNTITRATELITKLMEKANVIGEPEDLTIEGAEGRINVSHTREIYLVTVTPNKIDPNSVNIITHVLVPTIFNLTQDLDAAPPREEPTRPKPEPEVPRFEETEEKKEEEAEELREELAEPEEEEELEEKEQNPTPMIKPEKTKQTPESEKKTEKPLPEPPVSQFIVEDLKGLLAPSDVVRLDSSVIEHWNELYQDKIIEEADLETFTGKSLRCKVKPIKDGKLEGQGKIQIPGKLQIVLDIKKGELLRVKPAVELTEAS